MLGTELCYIGESHASHGVVLKGRDMLGTELYEMGGTCLAQSCMKWERHAWHRAVLYGKDTCLA